MLSFKNFLDLILILLLHPSSILFISLLANVSHCSFPVCSYSLEIQSTEGRKREKSSKFLSGLKNRKEKRHIESAPIESHLKVLDTIRLQMQVVYSVSLVTVLLGVVC